MNHNNWQKRRSEFNHDWLKLKYLNAMRSFIDRLETDDLSSPGRIQEFIKIDFPTWREHSTDAWWLVNNFEQEMSPKVLFNTVPLANCSDETKAWLVPLEHELWLSRCSVKKRIDNLSKLVECVDKGFVELSALIPAFDEYYVENLKAELPKWKKFAGACFELSNCLSEFPRRIEVL